MGFRTMFLLVFGALGLITGSLAAGLFRRCHFYLYSLAGAVLGAGSGAFFSWYALGYDGLPYASIYVAYLACGIMVAEIVAAVPMLAVTLLSLIPPAKRFFQKLGLAVLAVSLFIGVYGAVDGNTSERVEHYDIYVEGLPAAFDGYRFAQMTDTHIGPYFRASDLPGEFDRAKAGGAQVVFFTGDLIDDVRHMPETAWTFTEKSGEFPDGIVYVWGNHEYYRGKPYIRSELTLTPVKLLENEHLALTRGGDSLYVAGVDYPWGRGEEEQREMDAMAEAAWDGIPAGAPVILLAHHSDFITEGFARGAFLTLTGHTHGTQFGIFDKPLITPFLYTRGMYSDGQHQGYVSRGDASWCPFRFSCPRELAIFTLHRK